MDRRQLLALVLTAALAAGCAAGGGGLAGSDSADGRGSQNATPGTTDPGTTTAGATLPPEPQDEAPAFRVERAPGAVERVVYESTVKIPSPGFYVVDLTSGQVQTWRLKDRAPEDPYLGISDDRRWIVMQDGERVYWVNRESGETYSWLATELTLRATAPDRFLFQAVQESADRPTFHLADGQFRLLQTFSVDLGGRRPARAALSPDGAQVALSLAEAAADVRVYLVDVADLQVRELVQPPQPDEGIVLAANLLSLPDHLAVSYVIQVVEPTGLAREEAIVRRYSWQGELLGEYHVAGQALRLSPDGKLLVSYAYLDHFVDTTLVTDHITGLPLFRVLNAYPGPWTADSASLPLRVPLGGGEAYLISREGNLREAPPMPDGGWPPVWLPQLVPAPDDPDRFLAGLSVIDGAGNVLHRIDLPDGEWMVPNPEWGASGHEVVLSISLRSGKGNVDGPLPLPTVVQKPPFPDPFLLSVQDPQGDCLNLREEASLQGRVIRCLPVGTRLAIADLFDAPAKLNRAWICDDQHCWAWVRTEEAETGWVPLSTGSVVWAE